MDRGIFGSFGSGGVTHIYPPNKPYTPTAKTDETPPPKSGQFALPGFGPDPSDRFRFTWWTTPKGAKVWVQRSGHWRTGIVVHRGREYVEVLVASPSGRPIRLRRRYEELRRAQ